MWESIAVAVITAIVVTGLNEGAHWLRRRDIERARRADFDVRFIPLQGSGPTLALVSNVGDADAFDVQLTITGDAEFEIHPDARLDRCRPRDGFLVMVKTVGTGLFRIQWKDARGVVCGPIDRLPA